LQPDSRNRLPVFVSPFPYERALAVDRLMFDWTGRDVYAFPPILLIPQVVKKLEKEQCVVTLVAPLQWTRSWTTSLARKLFSAGEMSSRQERFHSSCVRREVDPLLQMM
jgi:hypothetical protein